MNQMMLDLETLDTKQTAVVVSIGAVIFSDNQIVAEFYRPIDIRKYDGTDRTVSPGTVAWWMQQSPEARDVFNFNNKKVYDPALAIDDFIMFFREHDGPTIWACGGDFDVPIMASMIRSYKRAVPWKYHNTRDFRTMRDTFPEIRLERSGTFHNALDDARYQALHLQKIMSWIKGDV